MSKERSKLECFVKSTLNYRNDYCTKQLSDEYSHHFMIMVQTLEINEQTIAPSLKIIAEEVFLYGARFHHVLVWLVFCIELDKHCKMHQYAWYTQEKLVEIIVNILCDVDFIPPPSYSMSICRII